MGDNTAKWEYNLKNHSVNEQPTMKKPVWRGERMDDYHIYIASLRSIPVPKDITVDWLDREDVTGKFEEEFQINQERYLPSWKPVDYYHYSKMPEKLRRIVAIPIKQEQPQQYTEEEKEQRAYTMQVIDVLNNWVSDRGMGTISQRYFSEVAKEITAINQSQEQPLLSDNEILKMGDKALTELKKNTASVFHQLNKDEGVSYNTGFHKGFELGYAAAKNQSQEQPKQEAIEDIGLKQIADAAIDEIDDLASYFDDNLITFAKEFFTKGFKAAEKQIAEQIAGYIHEIESLRITNRKLKEKIAAHEEDEDDWGDENDYDLIEDDDDNDPNDSRNI